MSFKKRIKTFDFQGDPDQPWIILFHGFGADAHDLSNMHEIIPTKMKLNYRFPDGVHEVPIAPGYTGRAWWPLTLSSLPHDWSNYTPETLEDLIPDVIQMIESLNQPWSNIILGGFSQGAMLATEVFLQASEKPRALISLSGSLIREDVWLEKLSFRENSNVFISHGENDQVLPIKGSQKLLQHCKNKKLNCTWVPFTGGHEIPLKVINRLGEFIDGTIQS